MSSTLVLVQNPNTAYQVLIKHNSIVNLFKTGGMKTMKVQKTKEDIAKNATGSMTINIYPI